MQSWTDYALTGAGALVLFGLTTWVNAVDGQIDKLESKDNERAAQIGDTRERVIRVEEKLEGVNQKLQDVNKGQESIQNKLDRLLEK